MQEYFKEHSQLQEEGNKMKLDTEFLRQCTKESQVACEHAIQTLNDLLLFDQIESSMITLDRTIVNANEYFQMVLKPYPMLASAADIVLVNDIPNKDNNLMGYEVLIDKRKIEQVIRNFFTNAIKFTKRPLCENPTITISITLHNSDGTEDKFIKFALKDNGAGISKVITLLLQHSLMNSSIY